MRTLCNNKFIMFMATWRMIFVELLIGIVGGVLWPSNVADNPKFHTVSIGLFSLTLVLLLISGIATWMRWPRGRKGDKDIY